jgi:hypothetical protein
MGRQRTRVNTYQRRQGAVAASAWETFCKFAEELNVAVGHIVKVKDVAKIRAIFFGGFEACAGSPLALGNGDRHDLAVEPLAILGVVEQTVRGGVRICPRLGFATQDGPTLVGHQ